MRRGGQQYLANLSKDETEQANFKLKNAAIFEQLKTAYEGWDKQMLPIPPDVRRGPWHDLINRRRNLEGVGR